jgi:hypothetical protein
VRRRLANLLIPDDLGEKEREAVVTVLVGLVFPLLLGAAIPLFLVVGLVWYESDQRSDAIQSHRAEITLEACLTQNSRHDATEAELNRLLAQRLEAGGPDEAARAKASRDSALLLIDALAPRMDCHEFVRERFGYVPEGS